MGDVRRAPVSVLASEQLRTDTKPNGRQRRLFNGLGRAGGHGGTFRGVGRKRAKRTDCLEEGHSHGADTELVTRTRRTRPTSWSAGARRIRSIGCGGAGARGHFSKCSFPKRLWHGAASREGVGRGMAVPEGSDERSGRAEAWMTGGVCDSERVPSGPGGAWTRRRGRGRQAREGDCAQCRGPGAWPGRRRGVRGLLHSGLLQTRRRTGQAGRHARVRPPLPAISVPPPARPPPDAASALHHLCPASCPASSRPASSRRRVPAPTAACLLGPPGGALSGSGAFLLHGASLPGRGLRNGPGSLNDVRVAAEPPTSCRPEPRPCDGPCQLCTRGGRGGASARRGVVSGMFSVRYNIKKRSFYIIITRGTLCVFSSRRLLAKVGNVKNPTLIIKPKWG